jgi:hypothetical protein
MYEVWKTPVNAFVQTETDKHYEIPLLLKSRIKKKEKKKKEILKSMMTLRLPPRKF